MKKSLNSICALYFAAFIALPLAACGAFWLWLVMAGAWSPSTGVLAAKLPEATLLINISNVALFNPVTGKGDRVGFKSLEDGKKVRVFKSNGEQVKV